VFAFSLLDGLWITGSPGACRGRAAASAPTPSRRHPSPPPPCPARPTHCSQGAQWRHAADIFARMQRSGCRPDVVTYTALIGAYERGGEWLRALEAFRLVSRGGGRGRKAAGAVRRARRWGGGRAGELHPAGFAGAARTRTHTHTHTRARTQTHTPTPPPNRPPNPPPPPPLHNPQMQDKGCMPDSILYSALLDALWDTGVAWAQAKAAGLYRLAVKQARA
jgi:pentatricopeptide repeat protein